MSGSTRLQRQHLITIRLRSTEPTDQTSLLSNRRALQYGQRHCTTVLFAAAAIIPAALFVVAVEAAVVVSILLVALSVVPPRLSDVLVRVPQILVRTPSAQHQA